MLGLDPKKLGGATQGASSPETETVRKIVKELDQLEPDRARYLAAYAYLLSRVAHADHHFSIEETDRMERLVMARGGVPEEQAVLIVQIAKTQNRLFSGTENFLVSREFGNITSLEQKLSLLRCLYEVCAADHSISVVEDNEIRKISIELQISHEDFIAVRLQYRDHLAVLKQSSA
jgi:uncharacterized tellurite resistance protein B-like protein